VLKNPADIKSHTNSRYFSPAVKNSGFNRTASYFFKIKTVAYRRAAFSHTLL
jgi:hypothetical protein